MNTVPGRAQPVPFRALGPRDLDALLDRTAADTDLRLRIRAVASVLPFRVNAYVVDHLIDWKAADDDPLFRLFLPQPEMLHADELTRLTDLLHADAPRWEVEGVVREIRAGLNPHPAGQTDLNVPFVDGRPLTGLQHKYRETVLYFPRQGQTCHAYCTYCFRWAQFVGEQGLKMAAHDTSGFHQYLREHREVRDVVVTGGDPFIMTTDTLRRALQPLLAPEFAHVTTIRIGTKALSYWPYRFTHGPDADDLCRLMEEVVAAGKHLTVMAHYTHPRELATQPAQEALRRVLGTGAVVRTQAPLARGINDDPQIWTAMWQQAVALGAVPYYMFVVRDTGPRHYFEVPLVRAWQIFRDAYSSVSGVARTVRGPSMSTTLGKVVVDGVATVAGQEVLCLHYLQARDPAWTGRPFFAKYDPRACWLEDLVPAFGGAKGFPTGLS